MLMYDVIILTTIMVTVIIAITVIKKSIKAFKLQELKMQQTSDILSSVA